MLAIICQPDRSRFRRLSGCRTEGVDAGQPIHRRLLELFYGRIYGITHGIWMEKIWYSLTKHDKALDVLFSPKLSYIKHDKAIYIYIWLVPEV